MTEILQEGRHIKLFPRLREERKKGNETVTAFNMARERERERV